MEHLEEIAARLADIVEEARPIYRSMSATENESKLAGMLLDLVNVLRLALDVPSDVKDK